MNPITGGAKPHTKRSWGKLPHNLKKMEKMKNGRKMDIQKTSGTS
jgi:hypothetical protein